MALFRSKKSSDVTVGVNGRSANAVDEQEIQSQVALVSPALSINVETAPPPIREITAQATVSVPADEAKNARILTACVTALTRSIQYRALSLAELDRVVWPAVRLGQCGVFEVAVNESGARATAVAWWAFVSLAVDLRLSQENAVVELGPEDWRSGDCLWLIDAVGDAQVVPQLVAHLRQVTFKGRPIKFRSLGRDGVMTVNVLAAV